MDSVYLNNWIRDESKVIDLGCGDGSLLRDLMNTKSVNGFGVENDLENDTKTVKDTSLDQSLEENNN